MHLTDKVLEYCTYVVREEEADEYRKNGHNNLLVIPAGAVTDFVSTLFWILGNTEEDVVAILDDDIKRFTYRTIDWQPIEANDDGRFLVTQELERIAQLLVDLNLGFAFPPMSKALYAYNKPFEKVGCPGQFRIINKKCFKATYDADDKATGDVDLMMQEVLKNRICLREMYFLPDAWQNKILGENEVGFQQDHYDYVYALMNKWGKYFDYNFKRNEVKINVSR